MKKRIFSIILTLVMLVSTCMVAAAADSPSATKNGLCSRGAIRFQEGGETVVIDSDDLYTLADRLDLFKTGVAEQLGALHTYLSKDSAGVPLSGDSGIYVVHQKPSSQDALDPLALDFDTILEGIAVSQSIPLDPSAYGMADETKLYKDKNGKLATGWSEGASQINIQAATEANLSAGTAAWVNGELLLGTGADMAGMCDELSKNTGSSGKLGAHSISSNYKLPVDVASAYAYVVTTNYSTGGADGNVVGSDPIFTANGGGSYTKLFGNKYARNGFNVRVGLYHLRNAPAGTVVRGDNGLLFY